MFGLHGSVGVAYVLCLLSAILCIVYGAIMWNRGEEPPKLEDAKWAAEEDKMEQEL